MVYKLQELCMNTVFTDLNFINEANEYVLSLKAVRNIEKRKVNLINQLLFYNIFMFY